MKFVVPRLTSRRRPQNALRRDLLAMSVSLAVLLNLRCSGCEDEKVHSQLVGGQELALHRRVCGSVAGYTVSIAPPGTNMSGRADEFEPFFLVCDCYSKPAAGVAAPVGVRLVSPNTVIVRYDASRVWRVEKQRAKQGAFTIKYETYGVPSGSSALGKDLPAKSGA